MVWFPSATRPTVPPLTPMGQLEAASSSTQLDAAEEQLPRETVEALEQHCNPNVRKQSVSRVAQSAMRIRIPRRAPATGGRNREDWEAAGQPPPRDHLERPQRRAEHVEEDLVNGCCQKERRHCSKFITDRTVLSNDQSTQFTSDQIREAV
jgi:hypothetical protein